MYIALLSDIILFDFFFFARSHTLLANALNLKQANAFNLKKEETEKVNDYVIMNILFSAKGVVLLDYAGI